MSVTGNSERVSGMEVVPMTGNETVRAIPENQHGAGADSVMEVEKMSDDYLRELTQKIDELRNKLNEEKEINVSLQDIICELQGRAAVNYQRSEDLGIQSFKNMMCQANEELDNTKMESSELLKNVLSECRKLIDTVITNTADIEKRKSQFKMDETVVNSFDTEEARSEELNENMENLNCEVGDLQESKECATEILIGLGNSKPLMEYLTDEKRIVESEILCTQIQLKKFLQTS